MRLIKSQYFFNILLYTKHILSYYIYQTKYCYIYTRKGTNMADKMNTKFKALIKAAKAQDHTNRLNSPHSQKVLVIRSITLFFCALVPLWLCLLSSTSVESPLQISSFLTNKANLPDAQMNVSTIITREYENKTLGGSGKNKANSKPNKANLLNAQMNVNKVLTKDYENKSNWAIYENKPNKKPIQTQTKPISEEKNVALHLFAVGYLRKKIYSVTLLIRNIILKGANNGYAKS